MQDRGRPSRTYMYQDTLCFYEPYYDTIYGFSKDLNITPRWTFNHAKGYINSKDLKNRQLLEMTIEKSYWLDSFLETNDYFFMDGINKRKRLCLIYSKSSGKYYNMIHGESINMPHGIINDIDGGPPFWPINKVNDNTLFMIVEYNQLKQWMTNQYNSTIVLKDSAAYNIMTELVNTGSDFDNPYIVLVDLK